LPGEHGAENGVEEKAEGPESSLEFQGQVGFDDERISDQGKK
jgi:hypothetical protein